MAPEQRRAGRAGAWRRVVGVLVTGYLAVLAVNRSLVVVRGDSMTPTLWAGDRLLTVPAWLVRPRPGHIVVARDPLDPQRVLVKRVHAAVGRHHLDVRGDDPARSTDSRAYGPLPRTAVRRVVVARWPDLRTPLVHRRSISPEPAPPQPPADAAAGGAAATGEDAPDA